jgi:hypothetical protein
MTYKKAALTFNQSKRYLTFWHQSFVFKPYVKCE